MTVNVLRAVALRRRAAPVDVPATQNADGRAATVEVVAGEKLVIE